eukprot:148210-Chlamydomonas_euryale.AAC.1
MIFKRPVMIRSLRTTMPDLLPLHCGPTGVWTIAGVAGASELPASCWVSRQAPMIGAKPNGLVGLKAAAHLGANPS